MRRNATRLGYTMMAGMLLLFLPSASWAAHAPAGHADATPSVADADRSLAGPDAGVSGVAEPTFIHCIPEASLSRSGGTATASGKANCTFAPTEPVSVNVILYVEGYNEGGTLRSCTIGTTGGDCVGQSYSLAVQSSSAVCARTMVGYQHPSDGWTQVSSYAGTKCPAIP